jgi:tetratricopeptide (TPR) repeat protein
MRKLNNTILLLMIAFTSVNILHAQSQQDMQKQIEAAKKKLAELQSNPQVQQAMQRARHVMDSLKGNSKFQKEMSQNNVLLDSLKKTHPELSDINMPDMNNIRIPSFDSINSTLNNASNKLQSFSKAMDKGMPQKNMLHHVEKLAALSGNDLKALANIVLKNTKSGLNIAMLTTLNKMRIDTSINIAATGAFLLASGASPNAAAFLICYGILKDPKDEWAVNDLGVYFRNQKNYEKSLQCYFYANKLDTGHSKVINVNIGWASAYYGDFDAADKYFDKALSIDNNYSTALEGKALLAYQNGDIKKLFECLARELKFIGGAGGGSNGPSDDFANVCAGAYANNTLNTKEQTQNPNDDHTFDNSNTDEDNSQDPPPGADVDDITYPMYKKIFVSDAKQIMSAIAEFFELSKQSMKSILYWRNEVKQTMQKRKPLYFAPYNDKDGSIVYPKSFSKFVALFHTAEMQFERRTEWYTEKLLKKIDAYRETMISRDGDMMKQYINELLECGKLSGAAEDRCTREVNCKWIPQMYQSKQNDLDVVAKAWDDYYNNISKTIQWFIDATAPFISRVHDEDWNEYLNKERQLEVRTAIINAYGNWGGCIGAIASPILGYIQQQAPSCAPVEVAGVNAPDPFSKKPKHIKEFEGPCYDMKFNTFGVGLTAEETCHSTTIGFEAGPLKLFYTHVNDPIYAQNHEYTNEVGTNISVSKDVDIVKLEGKDNAEKSIVSAGAGVEGSVDLKFDNNWNFTSGSSNVSASANIGGINMGGISATRTVEMVAGQLNVNPLSVTTTAPLQ